MPFEPRDRSGQWIALQDLAGARKSPYTGKAVRIVRGFLDDDPNNTYKGDPAPRYIVHGVIVGDEEAGEVLINSRKGDNGASSRDIFLEDAAEYLDQQGDGAYIDFVAEQVEGSQFIKLVVLDSVDA